MEMMMMMNNNINKKFLSTKTKNHLIFAGTVVFMLGILSFMAFASVGFDFTQLTKREFIYKLCFIYGISIISILFSIFYFNQYFNDIEESALYKINVLCKAKIDELNTKKLGYVFKKYCEYRYKKEKKEYEIQLLNCHGLSDAKILDISYSDLKALKSKPAIITLKDKSTFASDIITEDQYRIVKALKDGRFYFPEISFTFFLSTKAKSSYLRTASLEALKKKLLISSITYKIFMLAMGSTLMAAAIVDSQSNSITQMIMNLITYISSFLGGLFCGYSTSKKEETLDIEKAEYKIQFMTDCESDYSTGVFKPEDITEEIQKKILAAQDVKDINPEKYIQASKLIDSIDKGEVIIQKASDDKPIK
jgi:hypothetical protein